MCAFCSNCTGGEEGRVHFDGAGFLPSGDGKVRKGQGGGCDETWDMSGAWAGGCLYRTCPVRA